MTFSHRWRQSSRGVLRSVVTLLLAAAAVGLPVTATEARTRPTTLYHQRAVTAAPVQPGFPIDYVGVTFQVPVGADGAHAHGPDDEHPGVDSLAVRFRTDGVWGAWRAVAEDGAQAVGRWTGALVAGGDAQAYQVRGVPAFAIAARAAALNTTDGPAVTVGHRPRGAASAVTACKSRADWGADETIRTSGRAFAPLQVMTVHHTATENNDTDPDARVRAIYTYHVRTNGWDDIGYQALISEAGTVYEGRWSGTDSPSCVSGGGQGWEFGHQTTDANSAVVTGAHTGGYNTGNFGVALLGTFSGAAPTGSARDSLVGYLAELSTRHGIDPEAQVLYDNGTNSTTVHTISGHRDFGSTECPGGVLYADLPAIRTATKARMSAHDGTTPTRPVDDVATGETTTAGTRVGSYVDTQAAGGGAEVLTEVESGGKPARRFSQLDHRWTVPVTGASTVTFLVTASAAASRDGDSFLFAYSTDNGSTYTPLLVVPSGAGGTFSTLLPAGTSGSVLVRVVDTDRTAGNRALDSLSVDHLSIRSG